MPRLHQARKADMDNVTRVRQASIRVAKVQRRIWLLQMIFWPVVAISGIVTVIAVGSWVWRRRNATAEANGVAPASTNGSGPTKPTEARLNTPPSGNLPG
jgi:heme/copper-type cytochrome/quinol oxidase subunit 2